MRPLLPQNPLFRFFTFLFYEAVALPLLRLNDCAALGLRVRGRRNLRALRGKGAVLVCNHVHKLDCTFVGILAAPRKVVFTAMAPLFRWKFIGPLIHILGAVPVPAHDAPPAEISSFIRQAARAAARGRLVCVYPEGELVPYCRRLREMKGGAFLIAVRARVPVVPIVVTGRECTGLRRALGRRKPCPSVRAGAPVYPAAERSPRRAAEDLRRRTLAAMRRMMENDTRGSGEPAGSAAAVSSGPKYSNS